MEVAGLVLCCTVWFDFLMIYPSGSKNVGMFGKVHPRTGHEGSEGRGWRNSSTLSLTSALDGVVGQRHTPAALPPGKRRGIHCIGGCVGPRSGLDGRGKTRPHQDSILGPSSP